MEQHAVALVFGKGFDSSQFPACSILSQGWQPPALTERGGEGRYQLLRPKWALVITGQDRSVFFLL